MCTTTRYCFFILLLAAATFSCKHKPDKVADVVTPVTFKGLYSFAPGETITAMKANGSNGMVVATYNGSEGFVYIFTFTDTGEINDVYTSRYDGFDKIISLSYKE